MRFVLKASAGLHDTPNPTAPSSAGGVDVGDQVDVDGDITGLAFVKGVVVEPPPRRTGFIATAALAPLPPPSPDIDEVGFYTFLFIGTAGTGADQRYLFALALAESGLKNAASTIAGSDAFGPFQYTSARWAELLGSVGAGKNLQPEDRMDPFAQATLAILEEAAAAEAAHTTLSRLVQRNELYLLHVLPGSVAPSVLNAVKNAPTTSIDTILAGVSDAAKLVEQHPKLLRTNGQTATVAEVLDAAAAALQPGLDKTQQLDPPVSAAPIPNAGALTRTLPLAKQALARLLEAGWTNAQACGIIANIQAESSFDKDRIGDGTAAYGLCQWHQDRRDLFADRFGHAMQPQSTFEEQIDFITFEIKTPGFKGARTALAAAATPGDAAEKVCRLYEIPADPDKDSRIRAGLAEAYARLLA